MASVMRLQRDQTGRSQLQQYKMREYYVVETLECGHTLEGRRGKSNRATARRCEKCVAVVQ
jgi:hypothetical protein